MSLLPIVPWNDRSSARCGASRSEACWIASGLRQALALDGEAADVHACRSPRPCRTASCRRTTSGCAPPRRPRRCRRAGRSPRASRCGGRRPDPACPSPARPRRDRRSASGAPSSRRPDCGRSARGTSAARTTVLSALPPGLAIARSMTMSRAGSGRSGYWKAPLSTLALSASDGKGAVAVLALDLAVDRDRARRLHLVEVVGVDRRHQREDAPELGAGRAEGEVEADVLRRRSWPSRRRRA